MIKTADRLETVQEYYFSKKLREVRELMAKGRPIINMGIGSPDLAPSEAVINAIQKAVIDTGAHQYQSYQGLPELREAMAEFYQSKFGVEADSATEILPLMGSKEGIMHISMAFLNEGDVVLIPNPGYPTYTSVSKLVGAVPLYYDLVSDNGWLPDLEELEKEDLSKVKLMWLSYPHMPTGATSTKIQFEKLIAFARRNNILLINDNPYSFVLNDNPISILGADGAMEVAMELNSLSKTFNMAGWRVGMVLGNEENLKSILKVKSNMDSGMFYGIQKGAIAALASSQEWFDDLNIVYSGRKELMLQLVKKLGCTYDSTSVGMFIWAKLPYGVPSAENFIDNILYDKDLFITPGTIFGSNGEGYIRFSLCVTEEKIQEAIDRF
jgi:aspartate/methionine/tyrosine aminotransferase